MNNIIKCSICKKRKVYAKGLCQKCYNKQRYINNIEKCREKAKKYAKQNRINNGGQPMSENKECSLYLGVHVAEQVLSKVFKNVKQMPNGNKGYDFICNKNMKIDVKSSTILKRDYKSDSWLFQIKRNKIADYFLCLAFDNREDLNPLHIWLIPSENIKSSY